MEMSVSVLEGNRSVERGMSRNSVAHMDVNSIMKLSTL